MSPTLLKHTASKWAKWGSLLAVFHWTYFSMAYTKSLVNLCLSSLVNNLVDMSVSCNFLTVFDIFCSVLIGDCAMIVRESNPGKHLSGVF